MGVKLTDLHPRWIDHQGRRGLGISFQCMTGHCCGRIRVLFANPLDGGAPWPDDEDHGGGKYRWQRTGDTFEALSLSPSVDADVCGHFTLRDGVFS